MLCSRYVVKWLHSVVRWHCWHTCFLCPQGTKQWTQGMSEPPSVVYLPDLLSCCIWSRTGGILFTLLLCDQCSQITAPVRPVTISHRTEEVPVCHCLWTLPCERKAFLMSAHAALRLLCFWLHIMTFANLTDHNMVLSQSIMTSNIQIACEQPGAAALWCFNLLWTQTAQHEPGVNIVFFVKLVQRKPILVTCLADWQQFQPVLLMLKSLFKG